MAFTNDEVLEGLTELIIDETGIPRVTYSDPEVASVGLTETQAREKYGDRIKVLLWPFDKIDRALCEGAPEGLRRAAVAPILVAQTSSTKRAMP